MLDKEQIQAIFLSLAEWVGKQQKQLATSISTMHLALEQLPNVQCSGGSSFAKEMRALKMQSIVASYQ